MKCWFDNLSCLWRTNKLLVPFFLHPRWFWESIGQISCTVTLPNLNLRKKLLAKSKLSPMSSLSCYIITLKKIVRMKPRRSQVYLCFETIITTRCSHCSGLTIAVIQYCCQLVYKLKSKAYFGFGPQMHSANTYRGEDLFLFNLWEFCFFLWTKNRCEPFSVR